MPLEARVPRGAARRWHQARPASESATVRMAQEVRRTGEDELSRLSRSARVDGCLHGQEQLGAALDLVDDRGSVSNECSGIGARPSWIIHGWSVDYHKGSRLANANGRAGIRRRARSRIRSVSADVERAGPIRHAAASRRTFIHDLARNRLRRAVLLSLPPTARVPRAAARRWHHG